MKYKIKKIIALVLVLITTLSLIFILHTNLTQNEDIELIYDHNKKELLIHQNKQSYSRIENVDPNPDFNGRYILTLDHKDIYFIREKHLDNKKSLYVYMYNLDNKVEKELPFIISYINNHTIVNLSVDRSKNLDLSINNKDYDKTITSVYRYDYLNSNWISKDPYKILVNHDNELITSSYENYKLNLSVNKKLHEIDGVLIVHSPVIQPGYIIDGNEYIYILKSGSITINSPYNNQRDSSIEVYRYDLNSEKISSITTKNQQFIENIGYLQLTTKVDIKMDKDANLVLKIFYFEDKPNTYTFNTKTNLWQSK